KNYLDERNVRYVTIQHSPAFTAQEVAQSAHIPGGGLAKTVMVVLDGALAMAVLPANRRVQVQELRDLTGCDNVRLAHEDEFKQLFPDCEAGAMPPFGNLYGMPVYVAASLSDDEEISFNAGSHSEVIQMNYRDYEDLVKPLVLDFVTT
ncbi:MAG: YbaK/EbsC family protein, partial [Verrucomicrobia bacterium]|nr:YbaK/EbsC family protein [Verrucomicrobiota bacterium]